MKEVEYYDTNWGYWRILTSFLLGMIAGLLSDIATSLRVLAGR